MKRTRDAITSSPSVPKLPPTGCIVLRASFEDLLDGDVRGAVAWDPNKCRPASARAKIADLLDESSRPGNLSAADKAAWQYISRGPRGVKKWQELDPVFQANSRTALGFTALVSSAVRVWCVDDSSSSSSSEEESDDDDDSNEEEHSEEVSHGPIDDWIEKKKA